MNFLNMKITSTSDLHGYLLNNIPPSDILTISGDICPADNHSLIYQKMWLMERFIPWCRGLIGKNITKHVVFIAGNHDFIFQHKHNIKWPENIHYLEDSSVSINGVKFYGTPWVRTFFNWAFMKDERGLSRRYAKMPEGVDILLSHTPPYGYNDRVHDKGESLGSTSLTKHVLRAKPKYILSGHIHTGSHEPQIIQHKNADTYTISYNVSLLNEAYNVHYPHLSLTFKKKYFII